MPEPKQSTQLTAQGFTFMEVLVSVAIIAIAFVTLLGSQSQSVSVAADSRFNVTASLLAQQKLTELEAAEFDNLIPEQGDFGDAYPGYRWQSDVQSLYEEDTGIPGSGDVLKTVDLTVTHGRGESPSFTVRVIVMRRMEKK